MRLLTCGNGRGEAGTTVNERFKGEKKGKILRLNRFVEKCLFSEPDCTEKVKFQWRNHFFS